MPQIKRCGVEYKQCGGGGGGGRRGGMIEGTDAYHYCTTEVEGYNENLLFKQELSNDRLKKIHIFRSRLNSSTNYNWINQLSNTTIWWLDICCLLHRYQLHVSALMAIFRLID